MRGFILRLQHFSSTLRTNSKQALRKHRKTDSSSFQHDILDQGAVPLRKTGSQVPEAKKSFPEPSWGLPSTSGPKSFSLSLSLSFFFFFFFLHASETTVPSMHWTGGWAGDLKMSVSWTFYLQEDHFMGNRWGNSVRLYFLGLQNHCRWWLQPRN